MDSTVNPQLSRPEVYDHLYYPDLVVTIQLEYCIQFIRVVEWSSAYKLIIQTSQLSKHIQGPMISDKRRLTVAIIVIIMYWEKYICQKTS